MTGASSGVNEKQNVTITDSVAGDKVILTFGGDSTDPIAYDSPPPSFRRPLALPASVRAPWL